MGFIPIFENKIDPMGKGFLRPFFAFLKPSLSSPSFSPLDNINNNEKELDEGMNLSVSNDALINNNNDNNNSNMLNTSGDLMEE